MPDPTAIDLALQVLGLVASSDADEQLDLVDRRCGTTTGHVVLPDDLLRAALTDHRTTGHHRAVLLATAGQFHHPPPGRSCWPLTSEPP
jgi:hypothetical protein